MKLLSRTCLFVMTVCSLQLYGQGLTRVNSETPTLKDAFRAHFSLGTAMGHRQISGSDTASLKIIKMHFNAIVAENAMKSMYLQPIENQFDFEQADRFVDFGVKNGMKIIGHTLIWHSQTPDWFFKDSLGNEISRDLLIQRMEKHIKTVVGRYRGRVNGWDVVNEAVTDDGKWRRSKFYDIIGERFFALAYKFAQEADPEAELYYNDYNTAIPKKREGIAEKVLQLKKAGIRIDAIGMQQHNSLSFPLIGEIERSINRFSELGLKILITELDVDVLPPTDNGPTAEVSSVETYRENLDPYVGDLPEEKMKKLGDRYLSLFELYLRHREKIERVTLWGVSDSDSWLNNFPIRGRTNYPLLFDRDFKPKSFVKDIIGLGYRFPE